MFNSAHIEGPILAAILGPPVPIRTARLFASSYTAVLSSSKLSCLPNSTWRMTCSQQVGWLPMAFKTEENSQTPCPSCEGKAQLTGVRVEGALNVFSYTCPTCHYSWQASERWLDRWWSGKSTEPPMIGDTSGARKKADA